MERFLHLQLYDTNGDLAYDNDNDTSWGIASGSCVLDNFIMESELKFGDFNSALFEAQLFGIEEDLTGYKIVVEMTGGPQQNNLVTAQGDNLITHNNDYLVTGEYRKPLFIGTVTSSNTDYSGIYRDIEAYDMAYTLRDIDVAQWWDTFWTGKTTSKLSILRDSLIDYMQIPHDIVGTMPNDNMNVSNTLEGTLSTLSFGMVISAICQLQNCCPHIRGDGKLEFIRLKNISSDMTNKLEKYNSEWEDYTTANITGVAIYDTSDNLVKLVGTRDNVYNISGNILLLDKPQTELTIIATRLLNELSQITYTPAKLKMIESDLDYVLGQKLLTEKGQCYVFGNRLSGSLLIEQTLSCNAAGKTMSQVPSDVNDTYVGNTKVKKYQIDAGEEIVLKVQDDGTLALCQLMADASTGETAFVVKAGNFQVDAQGNVFIAGDITAKSKLTMRNAGNISGEYFNTDAIKVTYEETAPLTPEGTPILNLEKIEVCDFYGIEHITFYRYISAAAPGITVHDQTHFEKGVTIAGDLTVNGTIHNGSSRKIKENVTPITTDEAQKLLKLNPVSFDFIHGDKDQRGFIAEEVADVLPNLVNPETDDKVASLNYIGLIPYLVKQNQMQEEKINELETKIKNLEKAIEKLVIDKIIEGGIE